MFTEDWYDSQQMFNRGERVLTQNYTNIDPDTLCQCTGLKDSNAKLGYDGDYCIDSQGETFTIQWHNGWYVSSVNRAHELGLGREPGILQLMTLTGKNIHDPNQ